jgi:crotonobetainyl-CoA:carnitine CoA-transferase CaiB-like acyl-CoA transferase
VQSESGFVSVTGTPEEGVKAGASVADIAAGMYAYSNVLAALIERGQTGRGKHIDVSMLESMVEWMNFRCTTRSMAPNRRRAPGVARHDLPVRTVPDRRRQDRDAWFAERREWAVFCKVVLQEPDLATHAAFATNSLRSANRAQLRARIVEAFGRLTAAQVVERLERQRSPTPTSTRWPTSGRTRNWRPASAGAPSIPRRGRSRPCCRPA